MNRWIRAAAAALAVAGLPAWAQAPQASFPTRPVTLTVPVPPGGILDTVARMVSPHMARALGQSVVVDNRAGASGNIAATAVARAQPDGHTLLVGYSMFHVGNPTMFPNLAWDPVRDFVPVGMLVVSPHILAVHPSVPAKTLKELVAHTRANPGKLSYATSGNGSVPHVGVELFKQQNKLFIVHVPYRGASPALNDLIPGRVDCYFGSGALLENMRSGQVRGLAVTGAKRDPAAPELPTMAEAGVDYVFFTSGSEIGFYQEAVAKAHAKGRKAPVSKQFLELAGAPIIIASGLYIAWREHRLSIAKPREISI